MIGLDIVKVVAVIDHHAMRLAEAPVGEIAADIDALQPRAIAEMEARDRVDDVEIVKPLS